MSAYQRRGDVVGTWTPTIDVAGESALEREAMDILRAAGITEDMVICAMIPSDCGGITLTIKPSEKINAAIPALARVEGVHIEQTARGTDVFIPSRWNRILGALARRYIPALVLVVVLLALFAWLKYGALVDAHTHMLHDATQVVRTLWRSSADETVNET